MANSSTHLFFGAVTGLTFANNDRKKHFVSHNPVSSIAVGSLFGKLPDILEPSLNNPHHRQFCHSVMVFGSIGYGLMRLYEWEPVNGKETILRGLLLIAGCSYLSHLLLDSLTPRSLPLIGKL